MLSSHRFGEQRCQRHVDLFEGLEVNSGGLTLADSERQHLKKDFLETGTDITYEALTNLRRRKSI